MTSFIIDTATSIGFPRNATSSKLVALLLLSASVTNAPRRAPPAIVYFSFPLITCGGVPCITTCTLAGVVRRALGRNVVGIIKLARRLRLFDTKVQEQEEL